MKAGSSIILLKWFDASLSRGVNLSRVSNIHIETPVWEVGWFAGFFKGLKSGIEHIVLVKEVVDEGRKVEWTSIPKEWCFEVLEVGEAPEGYRIQITPKLNRMICRSIKENKRVSVKVKMKKKLIRVIKP